MIWVDFTTTSSIEECSIDEGSNNEDSFLCNQDEVSPKPSLATLEIFQIFIYIHVQIEDVILSLTAAVVQCC